MSTKPGESAGRTRRPRGSLTPDAILDAAETVAEAGFDELTVRAVAAELGASPMSLYRYFPTKDALVDALLDQVLGRFAFAAPTDDWAADLEAFARSHRELLVAHPWAVTVLFTNPTPGINTVMIGEHALRILDRGGLRGRDAVAVFSAVLALNYGWCAFTLTRADARAGGEHGPSLGDALAALPVEAFPLTLGVAADLADYGSDAHYDLALAGLLRGVAPRS